MFSPGKTIVSFLIALNAFFPLVAEEYQRDEWTRPFMGTVFHISVCGQDRDQMEKAVYEAFDRIEELEEILSYYREDSELNQLASSASQDPVIAGDDLYEVLEASLHWSRLTGGAFDCTIRPLINLWHSRGSQGQLPSRKEIENARTKTGHGKILLNPRLKSVRLLVPEMRLDLGGIAKGFSADEALKVLNNAGFSSVLIDAGGDLTMGSPPPGKSGWLVKLENLANSPALSLANTAIATSGDTYKFYEIDGTQYSHIVDPATGMGMTGHRQVTVIAGDARSADALATALSVMPIEKGLKLVNSLEITEALIIESGPGKASRLLHRSNGFPELPGLNPGL